jgi:hypothetical protein
MHSRSIEARAFITTGCGASLNRHPDRGRQGHLRRWLVCGVAVVAGLVGTAGTAFAQDAIAPDTIFRNGRIYTNTADGAFAEAAAVLDGRIAAVGDFDRIERLAGTATEIVDLNGRVVLPGFYDNHVHLGAETDTRVQDWEHIASKEALLAALADRAAELPAGEWILGTLQNENMPQARLPTRWEIDTVTPDHPVSMRRGHITLANSLAMDLAGITNDTPAPPGGSIDRNERGEPTGWFWEGAGRRLVMHAVPPPPSTPDDVAMRRLRAQLTDLFRYGITSLNVAGMRPHTLRWMQAVYAKWGDELPRATVQLRLSPGYDSYDDVEVGIAAAIEELESLSFVTGFGHDRLKLGAVKMSIDGGFSAAAFLTLEPHPNHDDEYYGVQRIPQHVLYEVGRRAHELGWQLGIHAIGDGAIELTADTLARIVTEHPRDDHRHFMHHVSVLPPDSTLQKIAENDLLVASQPNFTYSLGPYNASPALSAARLQTNNPQRSLLSRGIRVSYGSDGMPTGPLVGIYAAVTRKGVDGKVYGPDERVSLEDAIRMYTLESAYLTFDEDERGTIETGKVADMIVLGEDIFGVSPERIMDIPIDMTIVGGRILYEAP